MTASDFLELPNLTIITGGARSGKSRLAEALARQQESAVYYLATMEEVESDLETVLRIERHRQRRPSQWITIERTGDLHEEIEKLPDQPSCAIMDCLSLYVSNILLSHTDQPLDRLEDTVLSQVALVAESIAAKKQTDFILVTNEVGWGVVPENSLARHYRDILGLANQMLANRARRVYLCAMGLVLPLKPLMGSKDALPEFCPK